MYYLINESIYWADEFDVTFGDLMTEDEYQRYKYVSEQLGSLQDGLCFGTNEGWDNDFEFLNWKCTPVTDEEAEVLKKFNLPSGVKVIDRCFETLEDLIPESALYPEDRITYRNSYGNNILYSSVDLFTCSWEKFKYYIDKIKENND